MSITTDATVTLEETILFSLPITETYYSLLLRTATSLLAVAPLAIATIEAATVCQSVSTVRTSIV